VLLIAARFGLQITLDGGSSAGDIQDVGDYLVAGSGALFMGGDSGHEETRVGPHDLDVQNAEVGDGGCNCAALNGGHGSNGSATLDAGASVALQMDGGVHPHRPRHVRNPSGHSGWRPHTRSRQRPERQLQGWFVCGP
jgi:hypothetical protein